MLKLILSVAVLASACDMTGENRLWDDSSSAPTVNAPSIRQESSDVNYATLVTPKAIQPPPPAACGPGLERLPSKDPGILLCKRIAGHPWPADPCLGLSVVSTSGEVVSCE